MNSKEITLKYLWILYSIKRISLKSKTFPNLYFCGEVINIDGVTGGFNFQSAWSTAWIAAKSIN